jgi:hypothetical protein
MLIAASLTATDAKTGPWFSGKGKTILRDASGTSGARYDVAGMVAG